jgi:pyruvate ferredoxin oxidoreductase gamma subunit
MQLYVRWHSRAGQGAVTGAKALAEVMSQQDKYVQAYSVYGAEKRGAPMMAFDKISDEPINDHAKNINPDYILVIDPSLVFNPEILNDTHENTKFIVTTHMSKDELLAMPQASHLKGKNLFIVDAIKISQEDIGRAMPNTPILAAFIKVSGVVTPESFLETMKGILAKFPQKIIDGNIKAMTRAMEEVK